MQAKFAGTVPPDNIQVFNLVISGGSTNNDFDGSQGMDEVQVSAQFRYPTALASRVQAVINQNSTSDTISALSITRPACSAAVSGFCAPGKAFRGLYQWHLPKL